MHDVTGIDAVAVASAYLSELAEILHHLGEDLVNLAFGFLSIARHTDKRNRINVSITTVSYTHLTLPTPTSDLV